MHILRRARYPNDSVRTRVHAFASAGRPMLVRIMIDREVEGPLLMAEQVHRLSRRMLLIGPNLPFSQQVA